jgi:hypothetical protein
MNGLGTGVPAMDRGQDYRDNDDREQDIRVTEWELALLRARYDTYRRAAVAMRLLVIVLTALGAIAAAIIAVEVFSFDPLYGVFFLGAVVIFVAAMTWFVIWLDLRWIDFVSQSARGIYNPYFFHPEIEREARARSNAELVERQITDRERLLAELTDGG